MSGLESLLGKVELLRLNLEIEARFNKNLEIFKKELPPIYECFQEYTPNELNISLDQAGRVNVCNVKNGHFVYSEAPNVFAEKQYDEYKESPVFQSIFFETSKSPLHEKYLHVNYMNKLVGQYKNIKSRKQLTDEAVPELIQCMVVMGIGSGHHILKLLQQHDIRNLCLYDPHLDALYTSLHLVDWTPIVNYFARDGYSLELCIGENGHSCMNRLQDFFIRKGIYNIARVYLYKHYDSNDISLLNNLLKAEMKNLSVGIGFYDDERISLSHTVSNYLQGAPVARISLSQRKQFSSKPCVIVGNGPSLDICEEFLIKNQKELVIITSGTGLQTLEKMGIKPDIHIEQERPHVTFNWLKKYQDGDYLKDITLIGLNPVYPKLAALFKEAYIVSKPNDLGTDWLVSLMEQVEGNTLVLADFCNPTVTNAAASIALTLGFREIYLAGVDLGMVDFDKHHASKSAYFHHIDNMADRYRRQKEIKIKGNFRDEVYTTMVLQTSRINFEQLFEKWQPTVYNLNDGAFIRGAKPTRVSDIVEFVSEGDKSAEVNRLLAKVFNRKNLRSVTSKSDVYKLFFDVEAISEHFCRIFSRNADDLDDVLKILEAAFNSLQRDVKHKSISYLLFSGSINYILAIVSSVLFHLKDEVSVAETYKDMSNIICEFLRLIPKDFETNFHRVSGEEVDFLPAK